MVTWMFYEVLTEIIPGKPEGTAWMSIFNNKVFPNKAALCIYYTFKKQAI